MRWTTKQLAHACDVVVDGLQSGTAFDGNPAFIEAFEVLGRLLRGDATGIKDAGYSSRRDGTYLLIKPADSKPILNLRDDR